MIIIVIIVILVSLAHPFNFLWRYPLVSVCGSPLAGSFHPTHFRQRWALANYRTPPSNGLMCREYPMWMIG